VDNLVKRIGAGGIVDLQPLFFDLTLDVATAVLFGRSVYSLRANIDQNARNREFAESFNIAQEGLAKRFRIAPFHFVYNPRAFRQACKRVHQFVEEYIEERQARKNSISDDSSSWFMDQVAQESATNAELRDQLLNVLLAGRDTTACCLSWTL
jgi:cytochrome P450